MKNRYLKPSLIVALLVLTAAGGIIYMRSAQRAQLNDDLFDAALIGDNNSAGQLLKNGANSDAVSSGSTNLPARGGTALIEAAGQGHDDVVQTLLKSGASIESKTNAGITPLILAAMKGRASTVRLLLSRGANPHFKHKVGRTALDEAIFHQRLYQKSPSLRPDHSDYDETVRLLKQAETNE